VTAPTSKEPPKKEFIYILLFRGERPPGEHRQASTRENDRKWSSEKVAAIRRELLDEDKPLKLKEIAQREGVSKQYISELVGPLNRYAARHERILKLYNSGKLDIEIAETIGLTRRIVRSHLRQAGINLPRASNK
jgi:predicted DNA-binding protein YlxM (UPF0122 family)